MFSSHQRNKTPDFQYFLIPNRTSLVQNISIQFTNLTNQDPTISNQIPKSFGTASNNSKFSLNGYDNN